MRPRYLSSFLVCCAVWVCCAAGCATVRTLDVSRLPTFTLEEINAAPEQTVAAAITTGPKAFVVKLKKGDRLPVNLRAALGPIAVESGQNYLTFAQDLWLYVSGDGSPDFMLLSPDGQRWAPAHEPASLSKLFGLQTGTLQLGFGVSKEQGAAFTVVLEKK
jgi:hypothetical protein